MPKREDIKSILVIGSGPIIIGQASEFDYSGTQAIKSLKEEGYKVILVNSNPATIMTDTQLSDRVYIEPITLPFLKKIIEIELPDAILPTVGGQTALNMALELEESGILKKYNIELIGAKPETIRKAEDRELFRQTMQKIQLNIPHSVVVTNIKDAQKILKDLGMPVVLRPSFTLGGTGGGIFYTEEDAKEGILKAIHESPTNSVLIEQSVLGWKEFELEVMRDVADNVIIVCSIENFDPMGVHTGDSITVAPQQTLTDKEYQKLRTASIKIIREIGVETGGSNIQFAVNPKNGEFIVIEINPRVSRSSALASKATGFPIARIAAKLAVGYTLSELSNKITKVTPASFEPSIDYIVTKVPRFAFEKFPKASTKLGTQMKSVGEAMAIGRTFGESFQKALRSLETEHDGWGLDNSFFIQLTCIRALNQNQNELHVLINDKISHGNEERIYYIEEAFYYDYNIHQIYELSYIDKWFLQKLHDLHKLKIHFYNLVSKQSNFLQRVLDKNTEYSPFTLKEKYPEIFRYCTLMRQQGYSLQQIIHCMFLQETRELLKQLALFQEGSKEFLNFRNRITSDIQNKYQKISPYIESVSPFLSKLVDTCGAEFESVTPYFYLSHGVEDESNVSDCDKVLVLGSGPNRIGQGIEFDYCCCQASFALKELNIESIMINSNPETVSTDFDTSDRLYFEPITTEIIESIYRIESQKGKILGIITQFGGQTPLKHSKILSQKNIPILGTSYENINRAEDREIFTQVISKLGIRQPEHGIAYNIDEAITIAKKVSYPILIRPSYVLGGRAMSIILNAEELSTYMQQNVDVISGSPLLIDQFLTNSIEIDLDAIFDGETLFIAGILEHIEEAGIHSGDSACILPTKSVSETILKLIKKTTLKLAKEFNILGLFNIQFVIYKKELYIIELNPRASRTVPFISKALNIPLANVATKVILGKSLKSLGYDKEVKYSHYYVKEVTLPFKKFFGSDITLGPEMKSTGEVMGIGLTPEEAFYKAQEAILQKLPLNGNILITLDDQVKEKLLPILKRLSKQDTFQLYATKGTAKFLSNSGISTKIVNKVHESSPNILSIIQDKKMDLVINTPTKDLKKGSQQDAYSIRMACIYNNIPYVTTTAASIEVLNSILYMQDQDIQVYPLEKS